tara:strand:+ start:61237 stop:64716 length:3480 start_codon:yes stop_codon:yes gene_type:complete
MHEAKKLILVLGAHRSGTSLCAAALECMGAQLCLPEQYANDENAKGFFEHVDIVAFNDRLLLHLDGAWDNPLFDGPAAIAGADLGEWHVQACRLFDSIFGSVQTAAIKDPRLCQLLDFWMPVFADCGYTDDAVYVLHVVRDPVEVALSQRSRTIANPAFYEIGRHLAEGASLWLSLMAQALSQARLLRNYLIAYDDLLQRPEEVLEGLAVFLQLKPDGERLRVFCADFVDRVLHRSKTLPAAVQEIAVALPQALEFYEVLQALGGNRVVAASGIDRALEVYCRPDTAAAMYRVMVPALSRLGTGCRRDRLELERSTAIIGELERQADELALNARRIAAEHELVLSPLRAQIGSLESGNAALQQQREAQQVELERISAEYKETSDERFYLVDKVKAIEASTSWRLTRPIRGLKSLQIALLERTVKGLAGFRLRSVIVYHRMSVTHPRLAWMGRRILRPLFRFINTVLPSRARRETFSEHGDLLSPMLYQQYESANDFAPLVSVIVPNFNHAPYLRLRLDSIFSQTYRNFEVIMLDDASSDDSAAILAQYHQRYPDNSTLLVNEQNSGGVFHQWERGLALARGDIVWIAESDDWCTENFLETLVPFFENEAIQLAYARSVFMNGAGDEQVWSINEYLHDIDHQRWNEPFVETAHKIVAEAFAIKNIIPNVSSAVFRNPRKLEILQDPQWRQMKTCGDWVLYLHLIRGGILGYTPESCNFYRMHGKNTSVQSHSSDTFYAEHEIVAKTVRQYYKVDDRVFEEQRSNLIAHWRETRRSYSEAAFEACYSLERIAAVTKMRAPNLLMVSYAFCAGGGETFPVQLANIMKANGYNLTYLDCAREPRNEGIRLNLRPDIPVVSDFTQLERIVADFGIDLIHSHHAWVDSTILELLPEDSNCKTIVTLHGMYETINDYDLKPILPRLVKRSAKLIYVADKNLSSLRKFKLIEAASLVRIDNALDPDEIESIDRDTLGVPRDAFALTLVSRGLADKGWEEGIAAVSRAREISGKDIHLFLVGDGPEYERLIRQKLPEYIHLEGFQRNVRGYFATSDLGFLPSRFRGESFPLVIIECLQSGRPVLASNLGEIHYMLDGPDGRAGILVDLDGEAINIEVIAREIANLASDPGAYQQILSGVQSAALKFDPHIMAARHDEAYREAMAEPDQ